MGRIQLAVSVGSRQSQWAVCRGKEVGKFEFREVGKYGSKEVWKLEVGRCESQGVGNYENSLSCVLPIHL
ncbi:hypothetical protein [Aquiflexum sp.]|uniref:hypothetical protein n=1 Tax=Aquiflexum sp. TaxID=1872584 RepID=UPI003594728D